MNSSATALDLELAEGIVIADRVGKTHCVFLVGLHRAERGMAARMMGGDVMVTSEPGKGLVFTVRLLGGMIEAIDLATSIARASGSTSVTSCVGACLFFSGELCEQPLSFEQQRLRASHQP